MNDITYQCPLCKSQKIQVRAWVMMNDVRSQPIEFSDDSKDEEDYWCTECENHIVPEQQ